MLATEPVWKLLDKIKKTFLLTGFLFYSLPVLSVYFYVLLLLVLPFVLTVQHTNIHASGGIRTRNLSKRAVVDPRFKPLGHWDFFYSLVLSLCFIRTSSFVWIVLALPFVLYCTTHTAQTSMPPAGFEPATPASDRPQTLAFDRSATGIGMDYSTRSLVAMLTTLLDS